MDAWIVALKTLQHFPFLLVPSTNLLKFYGVKMSAYKQNHLCYWLPYTQQHLGIVSDSCYVTVLIFAMKYRVQLFRKCGKTQGNIFNEQRTRKTTDYKNKVNIPLHSWLRSHSKTYAIITTIHNQAITKCACIFDWLCRNIFWCVVKELPHVVIAIVFNHRWWIAHMQIYNVGYWTKYLNLYGKKWYLTGQNRLNN